MNIRVLDKNDKATLEQLIFTIENAQKQIGKEDKKKISKTISENAQESAS